MEYTNTPVQEPKAFFVGTLYAINNSPINNISKNSFAFHFPPAKLSFINDFIEV